MLYSLSVNTLFRVDSVTLCSGIIKTFRSVFCHSLQNVKQLNAVATSTSYVIAGCCFSKRSSEKESLVSKLKDKRYSFVNEFESFQNIAHKNCNNLELDQNIVGTTYMKHVSDNSEDSQQNDAVTHADYILKHECKRLKIGTENVKAEERKDTISSQKDNAQCTDLEADILAESSLLKEKDSEPVDKAGVSVEKDKDEKGERLVPNYFVAVQISDLQIHKTMKELQEHILYRDKRLQRSLILLPTLHITLMVMHIGDDITHMRALEALKNVHEEYDESICKEPINLEFKGLGHFRNRVLYAKLTDDESYKRLSCLADSVEKHFAAASIYSTDKRKQFTPHLTVAKLNYNEKSQRKIKKIDPSLYTAYQDHYFGCQTVQSIELLSMNKPKDDAGYYFGNKLYFSKFSPSARHAALSSTLGIEEKKKEIRKKVHMLTMQGTTK